MSDNNINVTAPLHAATKQGKLAAAREVFMDGDKETLQQIGDKTHQLENAVKDITATGGASTANAVSYSNETSGMTAITAQGAIDELVTKNKSQDAIIEAKAEKSDVQASVSELKEKNSILSTELAKKANAADVTYQMQAEQTRVNDELDKKFNLENIVQELGDKEDYVLSQKATSTNIISILTSINDIIARVSQILPLDSNIGKYSSALIDEQGNIGFALTKEGKSLFDEDKTQFDNKIFENVKIREILSNVEKILDVLVFGLSKSGFVDKNGNAALYADKQGVHLANVVSHDVFGRTAFIDEQGNIGLAISKNGKISGNFDIATTKKIKIGKYTFTVDAESINLPENLFTYNTAKLMLPSKIPYVVGQQMYVYYESILYNGFVKDFTIFSRVANEAQQNDCLIYHSSVEEDTINFRLGNSFGNQIESKRVYVKVLDKSKEGNLKICVIGDSKSDNATKQAEVLNLCQKDGKLSVTFVGTLNKTGYDSDDNERTFSNCAISGSGIPDWCCGETIASRENPFYDESVESGINVTMHTNTGNYNNSPVKFSIEKAISKIGDFDILWIDHGANQLSNEETFKCYDYIISDVKRYNKEKGKNIKIVISIQEGFGLIPQYDSIISNIRTKDALYRATNYIDRYDNRESDGVFICPQYLNVDLWNDFPCTMVYQNSRNKDVTKKVCLDPIHPGVNTGTYSSNRQYNVGDVCAVGSGLNRDRNMYLSLADNLGVEPNDDKIHWAKASNSLNSGYYKIADMYYATIRYILSLT